MIFVLLVMEKIRKNMLLLSTIYGELPLAIQSLVFLALLNFMAFLQLKPLNCPLLDVS